MDIATQAAMLDKKNQGPSTQLEGFLAKKGSLLVKEYFNIGQLNGSHGATMDFTALVFYSPGQGDASLKGLKVEIKDNAEYEKTSSALLDVDELESLSKAIGYIFNLLAQWEMQSKENAEIVFSTKGDFNVGAYQIESRQAAFASVGSYDSVYCFFPKLADLNELRKVTESAIALLRAK